MLPRLFFVKILKKISPIEFYQIHLVGLLAANLDTRNFSTLRVRVYTLIFPNISTLSFDPEITYIGVNKYQDVGFD